MKTELVDNHPPGVRNDADRKFKSSDRVFRVLYPIKLRDKAEGFEWKLLIWSPDSGGLTHNNDCRIRIWFEIDLIRCKLAIDLESNSSSRFNAIEELADQWNHRRDRPHERTQSAH